MIGLSLLLAALAGEISPSTSASTAPAPATPTSVPFTLRGAPPESRAPLAYVPVKGLIVFKMTVGGRETLGLLDTGASRTIVDVEFATAAGLAMGPVTDTVTTPTGTLPVRLVSNVAIVLPGQFESVLPQIGAVDLKPAQEGLGVKIEIILGDDLLSNLAVAVDPGRRTVQFAPTGTAKPSANFPVVDLYDEGRKVEIVIDGKPVRLAIDTGKTGALALTPEAWARVGPKDAPLTMVGTTSAEGQAYMTDVAKLPSVSIGPVKLQDVEVAIRPARAQDGDGVVGMGLLGRTFFIRDRRTGKLWLVPRLPSTPGPQSAPAAPAG